MWQVMQHGEGFPIRVSLGVSHCPGLATHSRDGLKALLPPCPAPSPQGTTFPISKRGRFCFSNTFFCIVIIPAALQDTCRKRLLGWIKLLGTSSVINQSQ